MLPEQTIITSLTDSFVVIILDLWLQAGLRANTTELLKLPLTKGFPNMLVTTPSLLGKPLRGTSMVSLRAMLSLRMNPMTQSQSARARALA